MLPDLLIEPFLAQASVPGVFTYFTQSNTAGKVIIYFLLVFSMGAWTVMLTKFLELRKMQRLNRVFEIRMGEMPRLLDEGGSVRVNPTVPYSYLFGEAAGAFFRVGANGAEPGAETLRLRMGHVENALQRGVSQKCSQYESKMVFLATIVSGAPFLGLLGTVWGVMDSFGAVALQSSVTLQMLAPGVSGALLTTVAGLVVAIPSVFGYNYLLSLSKQMMTELENYASNLADRLELENQS